MEVVNLSWLAGIPLPVSFLSLPDGTTDREAAGGN